MHSAISQIVVISRDAASLLRMLFLAGDASLTVRFVRSETEKVTCDGSVNFWAQWSGRQSLPNSHVVVISRGAVPRNVQAGDVLDGHVHVIGEAPATAVAKRSGGGRKSLRCNGNSQAVIVHRLCKYGGPCWQKKKM
jgi:hypothetical protein